MSLNTLTFAGLMPFTTLALSALADAIGLRSEMLLSGVLYGLGSLFLYRSYVASPEIHDYPAPPQPSPAAASAE